MNEENSGGENKPQPAVRIRSRFPKAQPNIALSSGLARIRRLSGHYGQAVESDASAPVVDSRPVATPTPPPAPPPAPPTPPVSHTPPPPQQIAATSLSLNTQQLIESVLSPSRPAHGHYETSLSVSSDMANSKSPLKPPSNQTFRQFINSPLVMSQPPTPLNVTYSISNPHTPGGSLYKPKFTKEHIMNIIKHKAMQKLKKNESENLRERRKKHKKSSQLIFNNLNNQTNISGATNLNENSNASSVSSSDISKEQINGATKTTIDRSKLRMRDFLYYSPKNLNKKKPNELIVETAGTASATQSQSSLSPSGSVSSMNELKAANKVTRSSSSASTFNDAASIISDADTIESVSSLHKLDKEKAEEKAAAVVKKPIMAAPQLKIADDGTIVINEESLVIHRETEEPVYDSTILEESENNDKLTYSSYRRFHHSKKWTAKETVKFYKALGMVGTDFTMIQKFFQNRSRNEIKRKFKREEKINQALVDKILAQTCEIDLSAFVSASSDDELTQQKSSTTEQANNTSNKPATTKKPRTTKRQKSSNEPADETAKSKGKSKLKRVLKRDFVGSESESDSQQQQQATQNEPPTTLMDDILTTKTATIDPPVPQITSEPPQPLPPCTTLFNNSKIIPDVTASEEKSENESEDSENEDGIELMFDMDKNLVELVSENESNEAAKPPGTVENEHQPKERENNKPSGEPAKSSDDEEREEEEGDNLIFDLDNNTIIRSGKAGVVESTSTSSSNTATTSSSLNKSSITITKINRNN